MQTAFHNAIVRFNTLHTPTQKLNHYFRSHPTEYKVALLANHIFRAVSMTALMTTLPLSFLTGNALCLAGSLFYRLTVETNCAYKFALPAWAGSISLLLAKGALATTTLHAATCLVPLAAWSAYIVLTVSYDVDHR